MIDLSKVDKKALEKLLIIPYFLKIPRKRTSGKVVGKR
jgi:hypothetical protein